ncbi:MAG: DNA repair protein RecN [Actinomycetota bacterium]
MLTELVVEGLGVIERAELELEDGCCALTGETGAGKTLLVAALDLLLGARSDRALVREGAPHARVEGRFVVTEAHPAGPLLTQRGIAVETDGGSTEIVLARSVGADGKGGRARINGQLATNSVLAEVGETLVEIAGQHSALGLGNPARQRALLDAWAGPDTEALAAAVAEAVREAASARAELEDLRGSTRERERELDVLRYEIAEISGVALRPGQRDELELEAQRLEHAESIALGLNAALEALRGEGGVEELLGGARQAVGDSARRDPALVELAQRMDTAAIELADVAGELSGRIVEPDPEVLEGVRERLGAIGRLTRKYGAAGRPRPDRTEPVESEVLDYLERAEARAAQLDTTEETLGRIEERHRELLERARSLAEELSQRRSEAAGRLEAEMDRLLEELALGGARFAVHLTKRDLYEGGVESIEFQVSANPGEPPRPVSKVASGGELSRIGLALHLLTAADVPTLVFDEVDAGVGGRAAQSIGRALARLARDSGSQVLVVTHLPQVAAFADAHYRVTKQTDNGRSVARVKRVDSQGRIDELSRMLAGLPESDRAREHAQELLDIASAGSLRG